MKPNNYLILSTFGTPCPCHRRVFRRRTRGRGEASAKNPDMNAFENSLASRWGSYSDEEVYQSCS